MLLFRAKRSVRAIKTFETVGSSSKVSEPAGHYDYVSDHIRAWNGMVRTPCLRVGTEVGLFVNQRSFIRMRVYPDNKRTPALPWPSALSGIVVAAAVTSLGGPDVVLVSPDGTGRGGERTAAARTLARGSGSSVNSASRRPSPRSLAATEARRVRRSESVTSAKRSPSQTFHRQYAGYGA